MKQTRPLSNEPGAVHSYEDYGTRTCSVAISTVGWAHYRNHSFCAPVGVKVNTYVDDAYVKGFPSGAIGGGITLGTWTTETDGQPWACPNLHYHVVLESI